VKEECEGILKKEAYKFPTPDRTTMSFSENNQFRLLDLLSVNNKSSLQKKAIQCIGVLSTVLTERPLRDLCQQVLNQLRTLEKRTEEGQQPGQPQVSAATTAQEKQICIQCIATISRNIGFGVAYLQEIVPIFLRICKEATCEGRN
jgi:hypothetical protein